MGYWVAALCIGLFAFAFVAGPYSCAWSLDAYSGSGVAVVIALLAIPYVLAGAQQLGRRMLLSLGFGALGSAIWFVGLILANFSIICRMF